MVIGTGIDIVKISRIEGIVERKGESFFNKIFTTREREYINAKNRNAQTISGLFASKEAVSKLLGRGIGLVNWKDIEILHDKYNKPYVQLHGEGENLKIEMAIDEIHLSISHEKDYAIAFAVGETCKRGILHYVQDDMEHNCVQDDMEYNCVQDSMEYNNVQDSIGYSCHSEAEGRRISYPAQATFHLPKRNPNSHKGNYGRIGIIAGSQGMIGSAYLASMAALRSGAGLVYNIVPKSLLNILSIKLIEAIILPVEDNKTGYFTLNSLKDIENIIKDKDVLALGPGIGVDSEREELVKYILLNYKGPIVLDADGLNCISHNPSILSKRKGATVLTPHPGEMARLLNTSIDKIQQDRIEYSKNFSKEYDIILALKGYKTIVTNGEDLYINTTGNPGMATAGSGDVLTGIITSFIGQGLEPFKAAKLGVYIHGLAGDLAKIHKGEYGLIARDIVENIPKAIYTMSSHRPG